MQTFFSYRYWMRFVMLNIALFFLIGIEYVFSQESEFSQLEQLNWKTAFYDDCTINWQKNWFLDGKKATVENSSNGMLFTAGPVEREDASHAVLWTKRSFKGDLKIEYDFTKMDDATKAVNILYIQATGDEEGPFKEDITKWADLRTIPKMSLYFQNMNLWHVSYAAFGNNEDPDKKDYLRARRYPVLAGKRFSDTEVGESYDDTGLFKDGVTYHMTFIKKDDVLMIKVQGDGKTKYFRWDFSDFPPVEEGQIGLRHMWTRSTCTATSDRSSTSPRSPTAPRFQASR